MNQKNLIFKGVVIVILVAILAGIVYLLLQPKSSCANDDSNQEYRDNYVGPTEAEVASLQGLIVLVQPGKRNALVRLPGLDLDAGVLLADSSLQEQEDGTKFRSKYGNLLENSSVTWLTTSDPWIYESSEAWIAGLELNLSIPIMFPPLFGGDVTELYIRMIPLLSDLKERLPECLIDLAEAEVPGAPEEVVTFWAYLIGEGVDNLNSSTLAAMNLTFGEDCLTDGELVVSDELFVNVTRTVADLLAPMLSNVMIEVLSLGNPVGASEAGRSSISVYGMSEWHLQLMLMCIRENAWLGKPGHHIVLELYDSVVNVIYGDRKKSMSTIEFVRSIALCAREIDPSPVVAGVLAWFFTNNEFSKDDTFSGLEGLRRLIILTKHGKHVPVMKLPGLKLNATPGSLRPESRGLLEVSGKIFSDQYAEFLDRSSVGSLHTPDVTLFSESSLALAKGMGLKVKETSSYPNFRKDFEEIPPSALRLLESLPECLQRQAEFLPPVEAFNSERNAEYKPAAPFLAYLIAEDLDAMSDEEIQSLRLVCSTKFLLDNRPLISPELFMEISMRLSETALDLVQSFRTETLMQILEEKDPEQNIVFIYGFPEYHLQSMFGCLNFLNMPEGRIRDHLVLEIYDKMIRIRVGKAWHNWDLIDLLRMLNNNERRCESWLLSPS